MGDATDDLKDELNYLRGRDKHLRQNLRHIQLKIDYVGGVAHASIGVVNDLQTNTDDLKEVRARIADIERLLGVPSGVPPASNPPPPAPAPVAAPGPELRADVDALLDTLPTAVLNLYKRDNLPIVRFRLNNPTAAAVRVVVESEIPDYARRWSDTVNVPAGETVDVSQLPILDMQAVAGIHTVTPAPLQTRVRVLQGGQDQLLYEQTLSVRFLARDVWVWAIREAQGHFRDLTSHLVAWITPTAPEVQAFLNEVAAELPKNVRLAGYLDRENVREQMRAVFRALHARKLVYVNSPLSFGQADGNVQQRVSLPARSLELKQANCLDGAVLYASVLEAIGLHPVVVLVRGHAFVGWDTGPKWEAYEFLETTLTGEGDFDRAVNDGKARYERHKENVGARLLEAGGYTRVLDVVALRGQGVLPVG